jgi:ABC-type phosphate/phosphonate transport system substrate-binding protein
MRLFTPALLILLPVFPAAAEEPIHFIGIEVNKDSKEADAKLYKYLEKRASLKLQAQNMPYSAAIRKFSEWKESNKNRKATYLARMTPYAYVAAQMLGAEFDILGTYQSKATGNLTYQSYFVVARDSKYFKSEPRLPDVIEYLRKKQPAKFIYHEKFSTSSFFLPSLCFQREHIFATTQSTAGSFTPIQVEKTPPGKGSSFLVEEVAAKNADIAAVWDGTKKGFQSDPDLYDKYEKVYFVPLGTPLPNDLLVCSPWLDPDKKAKIREAIRNMKGQEKEWINTGDFLYWVDINDASEALEALAFLRREARERPAPVTVRVAVSETGKPVPEEYLKAAQEAVRLSATEFVLFDEHLHKRVDFSWTLASTHDGAIKLTSQIEGSELEPQEFSISFMNAADLTKRIGMLIHSRLHRIRYVWPYQEKYPAVIRDFEFEPDETVKVQRIAWVDPDRNEYDEDTPFEAKIARADFHKFQLSEARFPRGLDGAFHFEPMSNVAYRVILKGKSNESPLFFAFTCLFVALLGLAMVGFLWDLRRVRPPPVGFAQTYQRLLEEYHSEWRERQIADADVLWCSSDEMGKLVQQIKNSKGRLADDVGDVGVPLGPISIKLSLLKRIFYGILGRGWKQPAELSDPKQVGNAAALDSTVRYLVARRQLSPFVGRPLEWEALDNIAARNFQRLGVAQRAGEARVQRSGTLSALVSRHFHDSVEKGEREVTLFRRSWGVKEDGEVYHLVSTEPLEGELQPAPEQAAVHSLTLEFDIPAVPRVRDALAAGKGEAWLLGKILKQTHYGHNGTRELRLQFAPVALIAPNQG